MTVSKLNLRAYYRVSMGGRYYSTRVRTLKEVLNRAFEQAGYDELVTIEDSDGEVLTRFCKLTPT